MNDTFNEREIFCWHQLPKASKHIVRAVEPYVRVAIDEVKINKAKVAILYIIITIINTYRRNTCTSLLATWHCIWLHHRLALTWYRLHYIFAIPSYNSYSIQLLSRALWSRGCIHEVPNIYAHVCIQSSIQLLKAKSKRKWNTTATATMAKSTTPSIELLTLLQQYESLHTSADAELKSSIWNITKARRGRSYQVGGGGTGGFGGVEYSADDVREELRAQAVLECKKGEGDEPNLVGEGDSSDCKGGGGTSDGEFVLHLDGMKGVQQRASQAEQLNTISSNKENEGLRRRRGNPVVGEKKEATQIIEEHNTTMNDEKSVIKVCLWFIHSLILIMRHKICLLCRYTWYIKNICCESFLFVWWMNGFSSLVATQVERLSARRYYVCTMYQVPL